MNTCGTSIDSIYVEDEQPEPEPDGKEEQHEKGDDRVRTSVSDDVIFLVTIVVIDVIVFNN